MASTLTTQALRCESGEEIRRGDGTFTPNLGHVWGMAGRIGPTSKPDQALLHPVTVAADGSQAESRSISRMNSSAWSNG
jgi:hypothetical protein